MSPVCYSRPRLLRALIDGPFKLEDCEVQLLEGRFLLKKCHDPDSNRANSDWAFDSLKLIQIIDDASMYVDDGVDSDTPSEKLSARFNGKN